MGLTRKKSGKALFEVITTYRQKHPGTGPLMPEWMRRQKPHAGSTTPMPELTPEPLEPEPVHPSPVQAPPVQAPPVQPPPVQASPVRPIPFSRPAPALEPLDAPPAAPMLNTTGGRLNLSLNYLTTLVVALGLVVLLVGTFLLGHMAGARSAPNTTVTATKPAPRNETAGQHTVTPRPVDNKPKATIGLFAEGLPRGKRFYLIQEMNPDLSEADQKQEVDKIVRHCTNAPPDKAVAAARALYITDDGTRRWLAIATEPFDNNQLTDKVIELQKKVEALGKDPSNPTNYTFKRKSILLLLNEG